MNNNLISLINKIQKYKANNNYLLIPELGIELNLDLVSATYLAVVLTPLLKINTFNEEIKINVDEVINKNKVLEMINIVTKIKEKKLRYMIIVGKNSRQAFKLLQEKYKDNIYIDNDLKVVYGENTVSLYLVNLNEDYFSSLSKLGVDIYLLERVLKVYSKGIIVNNKVLNKEFTLLTILSESFDLIISEFNLAIVLSKLLIEKIINYHELVKYFDSKFIQSLSSLEVIRNVLLSRSNIRDRFLDQLKNVFEKYKLENIKDYDYEFVLKFLL